jgi:hypothetical protein
MSVAKIIGTQWSLNAEMAREGEVSYIAPQVTLGEPELTYQQIREGNCHIRDCAQEVQNIDKGFAHCLKYFRVDREAGRQSRQRREDTVSFIGEFCSNKSLTVVSWQERSLEDQ